MSRNVEMLVRVAQALGADREDSGRREQDREAQRERARLIAP